MNISSIGTNGYWPPASAPTSTRSTFGQTLVAAASATPTAPTATSDATTGAAPDFRSMTPAQLYSTAQTMYRDGKISLDQSFYMQQMAGGVNRNAPAYASQQPVNYVDLVKSQMDGIASRGGKGDADYANYAAILGAMGAVSTPSSPTTPATGDATTDAAPDFKNMTPAQLYSTAVTMCREGKIGPDQLFQMEMMAGGVNRNAPAYANEQPVNYVDMVKSQMDGIASRGGKGDWNYNSYAAILGAMGGR